MSDQVEKLLDDQAQRSTLEERLILVASRINRLMEIDPEGMAPLVNMIFEVSPELAREIHGFDGETHISFVNVLDYLNGTGYRAGHCWFVRSADAEYGPFRVWETTVPVERTIK